MCDLSKMESGLAINSLRYKKNRRQHAIKYIGRKHMLNSFEDGHLDANLTIENGTVIPSQYSVSFDIYDIDFEETQRYTAFDIDIEAYEPPPSGSAGGLSLTDDEELIRMCQRVIR
jgi:hypothetical protein